MIAIGPAHGKDVALAVARFGIQLPSRSDHLLPCRPRHLTQSSADVTIPEQFHVAECVARAEVRREGQLPGILVGGVLALQLDAEGDTRKVCPEVLSTAEIAEEAPALKALYEEAGRLERLTEVNELFLRALMARVAAPFETTRSTSPAFSSDTMARRAWGLPGE